VKKKSGENRKRWDRLQKSVSWWNCDESKSALEANVLRAKEGVGEGMRPKSLKEKTSRHESCAKVIVGYWDCVRNKYWNFGRRTLAREKGKIKKPGPPRGY